LGESIALQEDVTGQSVDYVKNFTQIEGNHLIVQRLNNNLLILLSQQNWLFLARNIKEIQR
tara:strand:+ start:140 stop:322 length:183 start_codon:yes stop_codon:yes gene_type:complete